MQTAEIRLISCVLYGSSGVSETVHLWFSSPGTSGDTGGSAIQSAKGLSGLDVVVVYPRGRITPVQEKHMITCLEDNIHVFAGEPKKAA